MDLFSGPAPRWFTIAPERPFLEDLARALQDALGRDAGLADAVVLTPTRRSARALEAAFVTVAAPGALLLPQIRAVGDLEEGEPPFEPGDLALDLPPAVSVSRRRFELARIVRERPDLFDRPPDAAFAFQTADALAGFLDSLQIEEVEVGGRLEGLVDENLARHWRRSADVLRLATETWPARLRDLGLVDVAARRSLLLRRLAEQWSADPPERPLIAAGSTGSAPATAALLGVVARAPRGLVVLPGLDQDLDEDAWSVLDEAHPQSGMKRLLERAGGDRARVRRWPEPPRAATAVRAGAARRRLVNEALRPAEATKDWLDVIERLEGAETAEAGLEGLSMVVARNEEHAGALIALLARETLETEGKTVGLVCPDADLARRLAARLARFDVAADVSAGRPLALLSHGVLLLLLAQAVAAPLEPTRLLAVLKHPLVRGGLGARFLRRGRRRLEARALRGPAPRSWTALQARLAGRSETAPSEDELHAGTLLKALEEALEVASAPHRDGPAAFKAALEGLVRAAELLAKDEEGRTAPLWCGADGEATAALLASALEDGAEFGAADADAVCGILNDLLMSHSVAEPVEGPKVMILGALEARLVRADRLILAGLEEGVWPRPPPSDPFLSRPMKSALGLPPPERRIGLSAHDFAQAACAPEAVFVLTERRGGQPAVRSRWLWRLETLLRGAGAAVPRRTDLEAWTAALDAPLENPPPPLRQAERPAPRPPVSARPRTLAVTRIEAWVRDPYAVYARDILKLRPMDRPGAAMEAHRRGTALHKAFQRFAEEWPGEADRRTAGRFTALALEELEAGGFTPASLARERVLAENLGAFIAGFEADRRSRGPIDVRVEITGRLDLAVEGGPFTLTAKADRIELAGDFGHVVDFKTGAPPTPKEVAAGFYPQLTLTAAILESGGFEDFGARKAGELLYVRASGRREPGEVRSALVPGEDGSAAAAAAIAGLVRLIRKYDRADTPYSPWTAPKFLAKRAGDYDHLSRLFEWHVLGEEGEAEGT